MAKLKAISADSHVQENEELYKERVPAEYRHRLPHAYLARTPFVKDQP